MNEETRELLRQVQAQLKKIGVIAERLARQGNEEYYLDAVYADLENILYSPAAERAGFEVPAPTFIPSDREDDW
jgi:hypothetical protein